MLLCTFLRKPPIQKFRSLVYTFPKSIFIELVWGFEKFYCFQILQTLIVQKSNMAAIFGQFLAHKIRKKVKFFKSPNQICGYSPKGCMNQVSELVEGWLNFQEGIYIKAIFGYCDLKFLCILANHDFQKIMTCARMPRKERKGR